MLKDFLFWARVVNVRRGATDPLWLGVRNVRRGATAPPVATDPCMVSAVVLQGVPSLRDGTKGRVGVGEIVLPKWTIEFAMGNCV